MKLYEVNHQIADLIDALAPDPETGEIPANEDEILEQIRALGMKRMEILQYLAKLALNTRASVQSMKAEEKRLKDRREWAEGKQEHLISILDRECGGEKTDLGVATLYYRKTTRVEITDKEAAYNWLRENGHDDCYRIPEPELSKSNLGKLLDSGCPVPGAERVSGMSCYLR